MIVAEPIRSINKVADEPIFLGWLGTFVFGAYVLFNSYVLENPGPEGTPGYTIALVAVIIQGLGVALVTVGIALYVTHKRKVQRVESELLAHLRLTQREIDFISIPASAVGPLLESSWAPLISIQVLDDEDPEPPRDYPREGHLIERKVQQRIRWWVADIPTEVLTEVASWLRDQGELLASALVSAAIADREQLTVLERRLRAVLGRTPQNV
ncbi:hypothetical protein ACIO3S_06400 [Nocardioides sp. NPDC087217]|uniref:hypothetical protein n=1 Tax=Nocardioides sp. NPDC087217 TaxID=3364335 RepID=UPI00381DCD8A